MADAGTPKGTMTLRTAHLPAHPDAPEIATQHTHRAGNIDSATQPPDDASGASSDAAARPTTGRSTDAQDQSRDAPNDAHNGAGVVDAQVIFDERFALFMDPFGNLCDREQVRVAVAIVCDPKIQQGPLVMTRGHKYDVARILAQLLRRLKMEINQELDT